MPSVDEVFDAVEDSDDLVSKTFFVAAFSFVLSPLKLCSNALTYYKPLIFCRAFAANPNLSFTYFVPFFFCMVWKRDYLYCSVVSVLCFG